MRKHLLRVLEKRPVHPILHLFGYPGPLPGLHPVDFEDRILEAKRREMLEDFERARLSWSGGPGGAVAQGRRKRPQRRPHNTADDRILIIRSSRFLVSSAVAPPRGDCYIMASIGNPKPRRRRSSMSDAFLGLNISAYGRRQQDNCGREAMRSRQISPPWRGKGPEGLAYQTEGE